MPPRIRRSRAIWDEARRPDALWTATARAILYELQPIRFSTIDVTRIASSARTFAGGVFNFVAFVGRTVPSVARTTYGFVRSWSRRGWMTLAGTLAYLYAVRYVHQVLDAGPMVVIITGLVAIFTVGLGDEQNADGVSAYSVFNRGFQRLMGSVDVESLVQQYAGGALAVQAQQGMGDPRGVNEADAGGGADARLPPAAAAGQGRRGQGPAAPGGNDREAAAGDAGVAEDNADNNNGAVQRQGGRNASRRSGKKSRRRNLEVRREMQRQRQAAQRLGFAGDGGQQDIAAMNRLIEDQVAGLGAGVGAGDVVDEEEWEDEVDMENFDE